MHGGEPAYGSALGASASGSGSGGSSEVKLEFTGHRHDELGLIDMRGRYQPLPLIGPPPDARSGTRVMGSGGMGVGFSSAVVQGIGGLIAGVGVGIVPGAGPTSNDLIQQGVLARGTREARIGKAVGEIVGGIVLTIAGAGGKAAGIVASATGVGALVGVPAVAVAAVAVVGGAANVASGIRGLSEALSTGGDAGGGSGSSTVTTSKGRPLSKHAEESLPRHGFRKPYGEVDEIIDNASRVATQGDGATVYIQRLGGRGRSYSIAIVNERGHIVTALRNLGPRELKNLSRNYGFDAGP